MKRIGPQDANWSLIAARAWAAAIIPAVLILPIYIFPLVIGRPIGAYNGRRLLEILWAGGILLTLAGSSQRAAVARLWSSFSRWTRGAAVALVAGALLSALLAAAPAYALREWGLLTTLLVAALALSAALGPVRSRVLEGVGLTVVLYAILIFGDPLQHGFAHARFQGQVIAVVAPALLFSGTLPLALMAAPVLAVGLVNGSRALALALAVVTAVTPFLWAEGRRRRMAYGIVGLALGGVLLAVLVQLGTTSALADAAERGATSTGRFLLWSDAWSRFTGAPLLGIGPAMMARSPGAAGYAGHPHNSVMLIAAETGLVGLVCVGVLATRALLAVRGLEEDRRPWALALLGGAFHSLLSGTTIMPASQALLVLSLALVLPTDGTTDADRPARSRPVLAIALTGAVALAVLLATLGLPSAPIVHRSFPRFYLDGITPP